MKRIKPQHFLILLLVAAIAAAIAEDMGEDVDHIKILSIRRV